MMVLQSDVARQWAIPILEAADELPVELSRNLFPLSLNFGSFQIPVDSFSEPLAVIGWPSQP